MAPPYYALLNNTHPFDINNNGIPDLQELKYIIIQFIQQMFVMNVAELTTLITDENSVAISELNTKLQALDADTDNDGMVTVQELIMALNAGFNPQLADILLGFTTIMDTQQQLVITSVTNFISTEIPLIYSAIQQLIAENASTNNAQNKFKLNLSQIYSNGISQFSTPKKDFKLKEFHAIGPNEFGEITTEQLRDYVSDWKSFPQSFTSEEIEQLIKMADPDNNGLINYQQFANAIHAQYLAKSLLNSLFEDTFPEMIVSSAPNADGILGNYFNNGMNNNDMVDSGINEYDYIGNGQHGMKKLNGNNDINMILYGLIALVILLVVMIAILMNKMVCSKKVKYVKTVMSEHESEDELISPC